MEHQDYLSYFGNKHQKRELFQCLVSALALKPRQIKARKSKVMIVFSHRRNFAYVVSHEGREGLELVFSLPWQIQSARITEMAEPHPGRYSHHVLLLSGSDVDAELTAWMREAHEAN